MKVSNHRNKDENNVYFKNLVIAFGVCLSFLALSSSNEWSGDKAAGAQTSTEISATAENVPSEQVDAGEEQRTFTHYNFIASYLIQESSINRQTKEKKERRSFLANLKHIHKIIISNTLGDI